MVMSTICFFKCNITIRIYSTLSYFHIVNKTQIQMHKKINNHYHLHPQTSVIKQHQNISIDANKLAEQQQLKSAEQQLMKKSKMQSFLNSTKMNAQRIYKEKTQEKVEVKQIKKTILEKQKDIKSKYTVLKKMEEVKVIKRQPVKIDWKKAEEYFEKPLIPQQIIEDQNSDSDDALDTEAEAQKITNPQQLIQFRQSIRKAMLSKKL